MLFAFAVLGFVSSVVCHGKNVSKVTYFV